MSTSEHRGTQHHLCIQLKKVSVYSHYVQKGKTQSHISNRVKDTA